jgi:hypothetical protein
VDQGQGSSPAAPLHRATPRPLAVPAPLGRLGASHHERLDGPGYAGACPVGASGRRPDPPRPAGRAAAPDQVRAQAAAAGLVAGILVTDAALNRPDREGLAG